MYFECATGEKIAKDGWAELSSNYYFYSRLIAFKDNKAYRIVGKDYVSLVRFKKFMNLELPESTYE